MSNLTLTSARQILDQYSCKETKLVTSAEQKAELQAALLLLVEQSEAENLGVCADNLSQGYQALASYLKAFGYRVPFEGEDFAPVEDEAVYIKFNTGKMSHYAEGYTGSYRGVLVACQAEDEQVNGIYGHLPLDLFAAEKNTMGG
ncbi:DUF1824 family protein [Spirulina subsalsa FACHB-351]|uniref:DUF1824 family protein n=1 Tax=Spirulina subsalsa FACHB-351 TaxID=234711 RepID=A0ABT3L8U4_9CYAN|nr:DUF1824 family protein [Spirulina subsalsa]MCW6037931.1 DUF1824 family protein [Spirulina subsalsa FACHB-351]